ncbi:MAG: DUF1236 domain-containing protein [Hyphomicrobiaceae bacterium]|nr:MAG: DUF1236 domain-containing protein [Hyphomicrobiaceae bacterium]
MKYVLTAIAIALMLVASAAGGFAQEKGQEKGKADPAQRAAPQRAAPAQSRQPHAAPRARQAPRNAGQARPQLQRSAEPRRRSTFQRRTAPRRAASSRQAAPKRDLRKQATPKRELSRQAVPKQVPTQKQAAPKPSQQPDVRRRDRRVDRGGDVPRTVSRIQASNEQRMRVRERIFRDRRVERIPRNRLNVALAVGSRIPRRHRLHRLTPAILALAPVYAGYSYLVVDDTVCIVDPETYVIVDVLPAPIERAEETRPTLALSAEQMHFIYVSVPRDRREDVRVSLALGAEIPRGIRLLRFPEHVIEHVPAVEAFRFIIVREDVVIVDPADRAVVLVITE